MSAHTAIEGQSEFKKTLLVPPGIKVVVHKKMQQRKTWVIHGVPGWYIGTTMEN